MVMFIGHYSLDQNVDAVISWLCLLVIIRWNILPRLSYIQIQCMVSVQFNQSVVYLHVVLFYLDLRENISIVFSVLRMTKSNK